MKKLILSLFVAGSLTFGLQSCEKDDDGSGTTDPCENVTCASGEVCDDGTCVADPNAYTCDECGTYDNKATGNLSVANGAVIDTTWGDATNPDSLTLPADFVQSGSDFTLEVDLSGVSALLSDPIVVEGSYNTTTKIFTVSDFPYSVAGIADVIVNGSADFSTSGEVTGNLVLVNPTTSAIVVDGELDFSGTKQ